jgi:hypothetical protein
VEIRYASDSPPMAARVTDLSEKGLFVDVSNPLPPGSRVTFSFLLTNTPWDKPIVGEGTVVWHQQAVGMGIEFVGMTEEDRTKIRLFLSSPS